jgi:hypothetical protein
MSVAVLEVSAVYLRRAGMLRLNPLPPESPPVSSGLHCVEMINFIPTFIQSHQKKCRKPRACRKLWALL